MLVTNGTQLASLTKIKSSKFELKCIPIVRRHYGGYISISHHVQKYHPPNCMFLTGYHWSHLGPVVYKVQDVTLY